MKVEHLSQTQEMSHKWLPSKTGTSSSMNVSLLQPEAQNATYCQHTTQIWVTMEHLLAPQSSEYRLATVSSSGGQYGELVDNFVYIHHLIISSFSEEIVIFYFIWTCDIMYINKLFLFSVFVVIRPFELRATLCEKIFNDKLECLEPSKQPQL